MYQKNFSKRTENYSSQQRDKLLGLAKKIYESKNDERAKHLIRTIANSYSAEKDGHGATLRVFFDDKSSIMRSLAKRAYELTPHGKHKVWDYSAPVIQPVLGEDFKALVEFERFILGEEKPKDTRKHIIDEPNREKIQTNTKITPKEYTLNFINKEPRKKFSDKYKETQPIKEYKMPFKEDKKTPKRSSLDIDILNTLKFGETISAQNLEIANYFSNVGKKQDSLQEWLSGFNRNFNL